MAGVGGLWRDRGAHGGVSGRGLTMCRVRETVPAMSAVLRYLAVLALVVFTNSAVVPAVQSTAVPFDAAMLTVHDSGDCHGCAAVKDSATTVCSSSCAWVFATLTETVGRDALVDSVVLRPSLQGRPSGRYLSPDPYPPKK